MHVKPIKGIFVSWIFDEKNPASPSFPDPQAPHYVQTHVGGSCIPAWATQVENWRNVRGFESVENV